MIQGFWAVLLNHLSLAVAGAGVLLLVQYLTLPGLQRWLPQQPPRVRKYGLLAWAALPWIWLLFYSVFVLAVEGSRHWLGELPSTTSLHWHHRDWLMLDSWHAMALYLVAVLLGVGLVRRWRRLRQARASLSALVSLAGGQSGPVRVLETDGLHAFSAGFLRPVSYISRGLLEHLTVLEKQAVLLHEEAHCRRRDNLLRQGFGFCTFLFPARLRQPLQAELSLATEQLADAYAAARMPSEEVAATLLKVARLQRAQSQPELTLAFFQRQQLSHRVESLLQPERSGLSLFFPVLALLTLALFLGLSMVGLDGLHHAVDAFLIH